MVTHEEQEAVIRRVASEAAKLGLAIAPIGGTYFLARQTAGGATKDVDLAVHRADGDIPSLEEVLQLGTALGAARVAFDRASVVVSAQGPLGETEIELIRGKDVKKGYVSRALLRAAWRHARRDGNVYWYPIEFVIVMKADAAIDRAEDRMTHDPVSSAANARRAAIFREDVFRQVRSLPPDQFSADRFVEAIALTKAARRQRIADLIESAAGGAIDLRKARK